MVRIIPHVWYGLAYNQWNLPSLPRSGPRDLCSGQAPEIMDPPEDPIVLGWFACVAHNEGDVYACLWNSLWSKGIIGTCGLFLDIRNVDQTTHDNKILQEKIPIYPTRRLTVPLSFLSIGVVWISRGLDEQKPSGACSFFSTVGIKMACSRGIHPEAVKQTGLKIVGTSEVWCYCLGLDVLV